MKPELDKLAREILNRHCEYMDGLDRGQYNMKTSNALAAVREALESTPSNILMREALEPFVRMRQSIQTDIRSAHQHRANAASEWMREDDAEFRTELTAAFDKAEEALSISVGGGVVVGEEGVTGDGLRPQPAAAASAVEPASGLQHSRHQAHGCGLVVSVGDKQVSALLGRREEMVPQKVPSADEVGRAMREKWECAARHSSPDSAAYAHCGWPLCGCDPYANKVIDALQESGALVASSSSPKAVSTKGFDPGARA